MAIIHDPITIPAGMGTPSLGVLIGTRISSDVFDAMNAHGHQTFFAGEFESMNKDFFAKHVKPVDQVSLQLGRTIAALVNPDSYRVLDRIDDFKYVPLCMELPILMFEPVLSLFKEGRVEGWGYDPDTLPEEDVHGRILSNFLAENVKDISDEEGYYPITATFRSDDPDMTDDERFALRETRRYIMDHILKNTDRDPTAIDIPRG